MNFILIGDSGQKDPEVYSKITQEFPERILSVYIRDIGIKRNNMRIQTLSQQLFNEFQTEMILVRIQKQQLSMPFQKVIF
ncbi:MAG: App1 family protein [Bacteroidales bacterium]|nr:App1 family protein [Bacteroidales bacterium]